ncbi:MAG: cytochrome P450 [Acidimicrobiales bacterium]|jgi:cholest-4-en-3-one 26-monooxygenase
MDLTTVDLTDPDLYVPAVPHQLFAQLRRDHPVFWHEEQDGPGFWSVMRYHDLVAVNRNSATFSSYTGGALMMSWNEEVLAQQRLMMLNMDPPMHTRYRRLVNKGFTPRMVAELEQTVVDRTRQLVTEARLKGEFDLVADIAAELPLQVIAELMGVPQEDRHKVFDWSNRMVGSNDPEFTEAPELATEAAMELFAYADALTAERHADPHDDLLSILVHAEIAGDRLSQLEVDLFFMLLSVAGNETTRNQIAHGTLALIENPDQRKLLIERPELLDSAIEEMLRYASPVMHFRRTATKDTKIGGQRIAEGDKVIFWHASANRDEEVFQDPDRFDITRTPNEHVAFGGGGSHFCLGANLARLEMRIMFTELMQAMPDLELAGEVQRLRSNFINGIKHLPVAAG